MDNNTKLITLLAPIDSLHDFRKLDESKGYVCLDSFIAYYNKILETENIYDDISKDIVMSKLLEIIKTKDDVDTISTKKTIQDKLIPLFKNQGKLQSELNQKIVDNFNILFNVKLDILVSPTNINQLISDDQKIMLRHSLYYLIKNKDERILDFILKYMNLDIYSKKTVDKIKEQVRENIKKRIANITYPITYFDDTTDGLKLRFFRFNIMNLDKSKIDAAKVASIGTYFSYYDKGKYNKHLFVNDTNHTIGFTVVDKEDKLVILDHEFYVEGGHIIASYDDVKFKIKKNTVGRSGKPNKVKKENGDEEEKEENDDENGETKKEETIGVYQVTYKLIECFKICYDKISDSKNIGSVNNIISQSYQTLSFFIIEFDKILKNIKLIEKYDVPKNFDNKRYQEETYKAIKTNYGYIKITSYRIKETRELIEKIKAQITTIKNLLIGNVNNQSYNSVILGNIDAIKQLADDMNSLHTFFYESGVKIKKIKFDDETLYHLLIAKLFDKNIDISVDPKTKHINKNGRLILFYVVLYKNKKELESILNIDDLYIQLNNIYNKYPDNQELCKGYIVFLLFGTKRFGDWIQANLAKKFYFMLQSVDNLCNLYALISGAPVLIDDTIYNYNPPDNIMDHDNLFHIVDMNNNRTNIKDQLNGIVYKGLRDVTTESINRNYFEKYIKYKIKYIKLKLRLT
jgi:hypothetical protein